VVVGALVLYQLLTWPDVAALAGENPGTTAFIERYRERQRAAGRPDEVAWRWVSWEAISPALKRAVVVAEDIEFFSHRGFSTAEIRAAIEEAIEERTAPRGASTITQQLAKNLWLSPSRSPVRKLKEVILTKQLERHLSKQRLLEVYLNVVEFGPGIYGAEAAARHYFGKPSGALAPHEAAQLAAGLPRPATWNPASGSRAYRRYVAEVERRMERAVFLWRRLGVAPPPELSALDSLVLPEGVHESLPPLPPPDSAPGHPDSIGGVSPAPQPAESTAQPPPPPHR
jgi:monofunctional biosynthetic peptidoglycan transglycosylase